MIQPDPIADAIAEEPRQAEDALGATLPKEVLESAPARVDYWLSMLALKVVESMTSPAGSDRYVARINQVIDIAKRLNRAADDAGWKR